jgi:hypothetical protein
MTPEEIECFCEVKGARVRIESPAGTITYSSKGVQIGGMLFAWPGDPSAPLAPQQDVLDKAKKFVIQPKFGAEMAVAMNRQGGSGATRAMGVATVPQRKNGRGNPPQQWRTKRITSRLACHGSQSLPSPRAKKLFREEL